MKEKFTLTEKEGKKIFVLSDGSEVPVENNVVNDPQWVTIKQAAGILNCSDRWARDLSVSNGWTKAYAELNSRPFLYLKKSVIEEYVNSRIQVASTSTPNKDAAPGGEGANNKEAQAIVQEIVTTSAISLDTKKDLEVILKHISPHIEEFVATHKTNQERIVTLQERNIVAEKTAVFWKTSTLWITIFCSIFLGLTTGAWMYSSKKEALLGKTNAELYGKVQSTMGDLYEAKEQNQNLEREMDKLRLMFMKPNDTPVTTNAAIKEQKQ
jgi:hypothetical protein